MDNREYHIIQPTDNKEQIDVISNVNLARLGLKPEDLARIYNDVEMYERDKENQQYPWYRLLTNPDEDMTKYQRVKDSTNEDSKKSDYYSIEYDKDSDKFISHYRPLWYAPLRVKPEYNYRQLEDYYKDSKDDSLKFVTSAYLDEWNDNLRDYYPIASDEHEERPYDCYRPKEDIDNEKAYFDYLDTLNEDYNNMTNSDYYNKIHAALYKYWKSRKYGK